LKLLSSDFLLNILGTTSIKGNVAVCQDKDDFEATAQPLPRAFRKSLCDLCAFAPLRETRPSGPVSRKGAKAQRRKVRKDSSLNTQMQTAVDLKWQNAYQCSASLNLKLLAVIELFQK